MDESAWFASTDPQRMLYVVQGPEPEWGGFPTRKASPRQLRLFACAACRACWPQLTDARSRQAVETAERHADGLATEEELSHARTQAADVWQEIPDNDVGGDKTTAMMAEECCHPVAAAAADFMVRPVVLPSPATQAAMLRDIVGNPFSPPSMWVGAEPPASQLHERRTWLLRSWLTSTVLALAHACYTERPGQVCERCKGRRNKKPTGRVWSFQKGRRGQWVKCPDCHGAGRIEDGHLDPARLGVLADALEDAGCDSEELLRHLRGPGPHVRGCHVVDALLGKE